MTCLHGSSWCCGPLQEHSLWNHHLCSRRHEHFYSKPPASDQLAFIQKARQRVQNCSCWRGFGLLVKRMKMAVILKWSHWIMNHLFQDGNKWIPSPARAIWYPSCDRNVASRSNASEPRFLPYYSSASYYQCLVLKLAQNYRLEAGARSQLVMRPRCGHRSNSRCGSE